MRKLDIKFVNLVRHLALFGGSTTIAQFIMMVYVLLLARILGPEELGFFTSAYSITGLTAFFLNLGMDTWLLRKAGLFEDVTVLSGGVLKIKASIGVIWALLLVTLAPLIRPDLYNLSMMVVCVIDVWCDVCFNSEIQALNVQRRMKTITWLMFLSRGGRFLGLIILLIFGINSAILFALTRAGATVIGFVAATIAHKPKWNKIGALSPREILSESIPFAVSDFLSMIYTNADVTIVALMAGNRAVGLYSPASGIIHALYVIPNAIFTVIVPMMTRLGAESPIRFRASVRTLFLGFAALGVFMWLGVGITGKWLIPSLLGKDFVFTGELLTILSPIMFLKSIGFACAVVLVSVGLQHRRLFMQFFSAVFNVVANILIIPILSTIGVSWVYVSSELLLVVGYIWVTNKWYKDGLLAKKESVQESG